MAIRAEFRWLIITAVVVGALLTLSALALRRPNVAWSDANPYCPACAAQVNDFSTRCRECGERYDWKVAPLDESPLPRLCLTVLEEHHLRKRVTALGKEKSIARLAEALEIDTAAATQYLESIGQGRCGHCGGVGRDLAAPAEGVQPSACPVCFGSGTCIGCGGDYRATVGDPDAARAFREYIRRLEDIRTTLPRDMQQAEARRLAERFLAAHAGSVQAAAVRYWAVLEAPYFGDSTEMSAEVARERIDKVLEALAAD